MYFFILDLYGDEVLSPFPHSIRDSMDIGKCVYRNIFSKHHITIHFNFISL